MMSSGFLLSVRTDERAGRNSRVTGSPRVSFSAMKPKWRVISLPGTGRPEHLSQKGAWLFLRVLESRSAAGMRRASMLALTIEDTAREGNVHAANGVTGTVRARRMRAFASAMPKMPSFPKIPIIAAMRRERMSMRIVIGEGCCSA